MSDDAYAGLRGIEARDTNGTGNNLANPGFGAVDQVFTRIAENSYEDGQALMARARPLVWQPNPPNPPLPGEPPLRPDNPNDEVPQGRAGANRPDGSIPLTDDARFVNQPTGEMPQARDISNAVFAQPKDGNGVDLDLPNPFGVNDFALFFGQALTHDMVETQVNVTAVSIPASTGIGWFGGQADANGDPTAAFLVRVDPNTGQPLRDGGNNVIPLTQAEIDALPQDNPAAWSAIVNHQVLSLGSPFALQRTPGIEDDQGVRQQANTETAFLDLGNVYGKVVTATVANGSFDTGNAAILDVLDLGDGTSRLTIDTSILMRRKEPGGEPSAFLLTSDDVADGVRDSDNLLPTYGEVNSAAGLFNDIGGTAADEITTNMGRVFDPTLENFFDLDRFAAGDQRVNQNAATITQQTVWMRNHNWHAEQLGTKFPGWTAQEIYDAARALNEAEYQKAIYEEYLPSIIGAAGVALMGEYQGYDPDANPAVINEWTTIAFRFGHDQSSNFVEKTREDGSVSELIRLIDSFTRAGSATAVADGAELDEWLRGQLAATHQALDGFVVDGNRNQLFGVVVSPVTGRPVTTDLTVFDIVRGRDHGVNDYNKLREALGLSTFAGFDEWAANQGVSDARRDALKTLYGDDFTKLDAYVGVLLERPWTDSQLGETSTRLTALQFQLTRDGDRFYYENRFAAEPELLAILEESSMAAVLARTSGIEHVYRDAFLAHEREGGDADNNRIDGAIGRDLLIGFAGNDRLDGKAGRDDLHGGDGDDRLIGGADDDLLKGDDGDDRLTGDAGADALHGGAGRDVILGGGEADTLDGGADADALRGGAGDDLIIGGAGTDILLGEAGDDRFLFTPLEDGVIDRDRVQDFDLSGDDRILIDVEDPLAAGAYTVQQRGTHVVIRLESGDLISLLNAAARFDFANPSSEIELI